MISSLPRGAQIAGAAAVVLLIDMFLSWYGVDLGLGASATGSAWEVFSYTDLLLLVTVVATLTWIGLMVMGNENAANARLAATGLAALATLIVLYRIVNQPGPNEIIDVKYGAFVGLLACVGIAYGAITSADSPSQPPAAPPVAPPAA